MRKPASREIISASVELSETGVCFVWPLKMHRIPPDVDLSLQLKVSCKIEIFKKYKSALFGSVSHITILPVFTCVMNA